MPDLSGFTLLNHSMTTSTTHYDSKAQKDLCTRTEYEVWLLEAIYEITDRRLDVETSEELVYPPDGGTPTHTFYYAKPTKLFDWRPGFLNAGSPLIFITTFKVLDMLIEWALEKNAKQATHRFGEKIDALKQSVIFPPLIETRPWLKDRLVALYKILEPLRGTIIHSRHFKSVDGSLQVSSSKGGRVGPLITISEKDIRNLALIMVLLLRCLDGSWTMDLFQEKRLRRTLDELMHLHALPSLGQLRPVFLNVRVTVVEKEPIQCDLSRIRRDIAAKYLEEDVMFDLHITTTRDGFHAAAYIVPWEQLPEKSQYLGKTLAGLAPNAINRPIGNDSTVIAREVKQNPVE